MIVWDQYDQLTKKNFTSPIVELVPGEYLINLLVLSKFIKKPWWYAIQVIVKDDGTVMKCEQIADGKAKES